MKRLSRQLAEAEEALANQDRGRKPSSAEGAAKKEQRKIELQEAIAKLNEQIEGCKALLKKLKN